MSQIVGTNTKHLAAKGFDTGVLRTELSPFSYSTLLSKDYNRQRVMNGTVAKVYDFMGTMKNWIILVL